jgi:hypothetical protein
VSVCVCRRRCRLAPCWSACAFDTACRQLWLEELAGEGGHGSDEEEDSDEDDSDSDNSEDDSEEDSESDEEDEEDDSEEEDSDEERYEDY